MNENYGSLEVSSLAMMFLESIPRYKKLSILLLSGENMKFKSTIALQLFKNISMAGEKN